MNAVPRRDELLEMLTVTTVSSGEREDLRVPVSSLFSFPDALPGLPDSHRYALIERPDGEPFRWLQSLDEPLVCLPLLAGSSLVLAGYISAVAEAVAVEDVSLADRLMLVARFDESTGSFLVNLVAPILLDCDAGLGRQLILDRQGYALRQIIAWDPEAGVFRLPE
jgi:flagellar assembly factor FliW